MGHQRGGRPTTRTENRKSKGEMADSDMPNGKRETLRTPSHWAGLCVWAHHEQLMVTRLSHDYTPDGCLIRIIHEASTAAVDPGMSTALRSVGLLDVLSSRPAEPSVARLVSMPVCAASRRTFMNNAG